MAKKSRIPIELLAGERGAKEKAPEIIACNDYLSLGPGRSLVRLAEIYQAETNQLPPTTSYPVIKKWSFMYSWAARAEEYDGQIEAEKNLRMAERRREIMEEGLALDFERVNHLKHIATVLFDQFNEVVDGKRVNLWVRDVKQIGQGPMAERVDIERFNAALVEQLRGALDDIAKEKGERKLRVESSSIAVNLTAEDMASAQKKLDEWEANRFSDLPSVIASGEEEDAVND